MQRCRSEEEGRSNAVEEQCVGSCEVAGCARHMGLESIAAGLAQTALLRDQRRRYREARGERLENGISRSDYGGICSYSVVFVGLGGCVVDGLTSGVARRGCSLAALPAADSIAPAQSPPAISDAIRATHRTHQL